MDSPAVGSLYAGHPYCMSLFRQNIGYQSRMARGVIGAILLMAGIIMADIELWACLALVLLGLIAIFEAVRGWCLTRVLRGRTSDIQPYDLPEA